MSLTHWASPIVSKHKAKPYHNYETKVNPEMIRGGGSYKLLTIARSLGVRVRFIFMNTHENKVPSK